MSEIATAPKTVSLLGSALTIAETPSSDSVWNWSSDSSNDSSESQLGVMVLGVDKVRASLVRQFAYQQRKMVQADVPNALDLQQNMYTWCSRSVTFMDTDYLVCIRNASQLEETYESQMKNQLLKEEVSNCVGYLCIYDITSRESFDSMLRYHRYVERVKGVSRFPMVLIGSQSAESRTAPRQVSADEALEFAYQCDCAFAEIPLDDGVQVYDAFLQLVAEILRHQGKAPRSSLNRGRDATILGDRRGGVRYSILDTEYIKFVQPKNPNDKPEVRAATVDKLIERLTYHKYPDPTFVTTFLITYRSFLSPKELLQRLVARYEMQPSTTLQPDKLAEWERIEKGPVRQRVISVLRQWLSTHWVDYANDPQLISLLDQFMLNLTNDRDGANWAKNLHKTLELRRAQPNSMTQSDVNLNKVPPKSLVTKQMLAPGKLTSTSLLMDLPPEEVARHLAMIDFWMLRNVPSHEFVDQAWNRHESEIRAPNTLRVIHRFNQVSKWISTEIVSVPRMGGRARILTRCVELAYRCYKLQDFSAVLAILSGVDSCSVHRMTMTWKRLPKKNLQMYKELKELTDPNLTYVEDGNRDYVDGGLVNFEKRAKLAHVIQDIISSVADLYILKEEPVLRNALLGVTYIDEEAQYAASCAAEPRIEGQVAATNASKAAKKSSSSSRKSSTQSSKVGKSSANNQGSPRSNPHVLSASASSVMQTTGTADAEEEDEVDAAVLENSIAALFSNSIPSQELTMRSKQLSRRYGSTAQRKQVKPVSAEAISEAFANSSGASDAKSGAEDVLISEALETSVTQPNSTVFRLLTAILDELSEVAAISGRAFFVSSNSAHKTQAFRIVKRWCDLMDADERAANPIPYLHTSADVWFTFRELFLGSDALSQLVASMMRPRSGHVQKSKDQLTNILDTEQAVLKLAHACLRGNVAYDQILQLQAMVLRVNMFTNAVSKTDVSPASSALATSGTAGGEASAEETESDIDAACDRMALLIRQVYQRRPLPGMVMQRLIQNRMELDSLRARARAIANEEGVHTSTNHYTMVQLRQRIVELAAESLEILQVAQISEPKSLMWTLLPLEEGLPIAEEKTALLEKLTRYPNVQRAAGEFTTLLDKHDREMQTQRSRGHAAVLKSCFSMFWESVRAYLIVAWTHMGLLRKRREKLMSLRPGDLGGLGLESVAEVLVVERQRDRQHLAAISKIVSMVETHAQALTAASKCGALASSASGSSTASVGVSRASLSLPANGAGGVSRSSIAAAEISGVALQNARLGSVVEGMGGALLSQKDVQDMLNKYRVMELIMNVRQMESDLEDQSNLEEGATDEGDFAD